jgi:MFS family permease
MMSLVVIAGAAMQMPIGRVSDMTDRRYVLAAARRRGRRRHLFLMPRDGMLVIAMTAAYGALAYALYPIAVAHANDHAGPNDFAKISSGLLLLYGFGTMVGPILASVLMEYLRPESLFVATALAHFALAAYTILRIKRRAPVPVGSRESFKTMPPTGPRHRKRHGSTHAPETRIRHVSSSPRPDFNPSGHCQRSFPSLEGRRRMALRLSNSK